MRSSCVLALVAAMACAGSPAPGAGGAAPPAGDSRTPIERRRDVACEQLGPRLTACAVEDARAELAAGKITQQQFDRDVAPDIQRRNTEDFVKVCKSTAYSSRQVRVLEVCPREEARCAPMLDCLDHLGDDAPPQ